MTDKVHIKLSKTKEVVISNILSLIADKLILGGNMKKSLLILSIVSIISFSYAMPIGIEAGAGYVLAENDNHLFINGSALVNIVNNFYIRTELARLSFHSGSTLISLGTMSPVDLMLFFPSNTFNPYGLAGVNLTTGGGATYFNLRAGAGVEFKFNEARFYPFVEGDLDLYSWSSGGVSTTHNVITLKGGIRIK